MDGVDWFVSGGFTVSSIIWCCMICIVFLNFECVVCGAWGVWKCAAEERIGGTTNPAPSHPAPPQLLFLLLQLLQLLRMQVLMIHAWHLVCSIGCVVVKLVNMYCLVVCIVWLFVQQRSGGRRSLLLLLFALRLCYTTRTSDTQLH